MTKLTPPTRVVRRLAVIAGAVALAVQAVIGATQVYTTDADFDTGALFNVNHAPPNNDQLQLNLQSETFPVLWVANAGEDTLSKIDTNTGKETARYRTWFNVGTHGFLSGPAPSRTAVDADGNCYVANRHFDGRPAEVMKILASGGVDRNSNGTIETSTDLDSNGVISGAEILPMTDLNADSIVQPNEIADERIAWIVRVGDPGLLGRSLTIDPNGFIWLGLFSGRVYYKLNPTNGAIVAGPINVAPNSPYGAVVDASGILWGASGSNNLLKLDTNTNTMVSSFTHGGFNYGIGYGSNRVYLGASNPVRVFDPVTELFSEINLGFSAYAVSTASNGDLLVHGHTGGGFSGATRFRPDGSIVWSKPNQAGANDFDGRGCMPDANGDVWTINLGTSNVSKYDGDDGAPLGVFPVGLSPYSYSDATGSTFVQTIGLGRWTVVYDTTAPGTNNVVVSWNASQPGQSKLTVAAAASDTNSTPGSYAPGDFTPVTSGNTTGQTGRYHAFQVTLTADPSNNQSPILFDLTVQTPEACGVFDLDGNGCVDRADVNLSIAAIRQGTTDLRYDANCDGNVDVSDARHIATKFTNAGGLPCVVAVQ